MIRFTQQLARSEKTFRSSYLISRYFLCAITVLLLLMLAYTFAFGVNVQTSLQSMLPQDSGNRISHQVANRLLAQGESLAFLLVEAPSQKELLSSVANVKAKVRNSSYLRLNARLAEDLVETSLLLDTLKLNQFNFLSREHQELLESGNSLPILNNAAASLFDIASSASVIPATGDPLGLFNTWFTQTYLPSRAFSIEDGILFLDSSAESRPAAMFVLKLSDDGLSSAVQSDVNSFYQSLTQVLPDNVVLARSGLVFHSAATAAKAKVEMSMISLVSVCGILCLFMFAFRSLKAIFVSVGAILFGCFAGALVTHTLFGQLHIFTLVFGAALIGVAVDYTFHFMAHYFYTKPRVNGLGVLVAILPGLFAGLMTSLLGFGCLLLSNLPGLDQIAVFSMAGLFSSWLAVVVLFPIVTVALNDKPLERRFSFLVRVCESPMAVASALWRRKASRCGLLVMLIAALYCVSDIRVISDLRSLNASPPALIAEEQYLRKRLDLSISNQFFIVRADTEQQLLRSEERLLQMLEPAKKEGQLQKINAVSQLLPSVQQQGNNYRLYKEVLIDEPAILRSFMLDMGFALPSIEAFHQRFNEAEGIGLDVSDWLSIPNLPQSSHLWFGVVDGRFTSVVMLGGVAASHKLQGIADLDPAWLFVDKIDEISAGLEQQRQQASWLLAVAYLMICMFLGIRFNFISSLKLIAIPLLSTFSILVVFSVLGVGLSVFHVFGLFLVLGLGMDYGIFLLGSAEKCSRVSFVAILLSVITSCLSFGLLAVSSIPMIAAFGFTILLGSLFNWVFVSIFISPKATVLESG